MPTTIRFENPPIIELVCGIQYDIEQYTFILENDFYSRVKNSFPHMEINPPLSLVFDKLSTTSSKDSERKPPFFKRYFFIDENKSKLIQLQEGRYLFNWRKVEGENVIYPTFNNVYKEFYENWKILEDVFKSNQINYAVNQLELTYIDHIDIGEFNAEVAKIDDIFIFFNNISQLTKIDTLNINLSIPLKELSGHINLKLDTAIRKQDQKGVIVFDSTVRGMMNKEVKAIDDWFLKAHDQAIRLFVELLTDKAKQKWGFKDV